MRAGAYTNRINVLRKQVEVSDYGTDKLTWRIATSTLAKVDYIDGDKVEENRETFFTKRVTFTLRAYIDVQNEDRIEFQNEKYRILSINRENDTTHNDIVVKTELINE